MIVEFRNITITIATKHSAKDAYVALCKAMDKSKLYWSSDTFVAYNQGDCEADIVEKSTGILQDLNRSGEVEEEGQ